MDGSQPCDPASVFPEIVVETEQEQGDFEENSSRWTWLDRLYEKAENFFEYLLTTNSFDSTGLGTGFAPAGELVKGVESGALERD